MKDTDMRSCIFRTGHCFAGPRFIEEKKETEEAFHRFGKSTAYHRVMECLEYNKTDSAQALKEQINALVQSKKMSEAEAECIRISDIQSFGRGTGAENESRCIIGASFQGTAFCHFQKCC